MSTAFVRLAPSTVVSTLVTVALLRCRCAVAALSLCRGVLCCAVLRCAVLPVDEDDDRQGMGALDETPDTTVWKCVERTEKLEKEG